MFSNLERVTASGSCRRSNNLEGVVIAGRGSETRIVGIKDLQVEIRARQIRIIRVRRIRIERQYETSRFSSQEWDSNVDVSGGRAVHRSCLPPSVDSPSDVNRRLAH